MASTDASSSVFKAAVSKPDKADATTRAALQIITDEAKRRELKTARLREARLAAEAAENTAAEEADAGEPKKAGRAKAAGAKKRVKA